MLIYQLLPRLWGNPVEDPVKGGKVERNGCGTFSSVDGVSLKYLKDTGFTHVWYTGVIRHATCCATRGCTPSDPSWVKGEAGSPYAITDYYDVNPYLADNPDRRMEEFRALVERTHAAGLKVIIDFVPNHVARDYGRHSDGTHPVLGASDDRSVHWAPGNDFFYYPGQPLRLPVPSNYVEDPARATGNCFSPFPGIHDWYETIKLNYCDFHTPTWDKMLDAVLFWAGLGVDGFRCDMVELVPEAFFTWLIAQVKARFPGIVFIAEVYQKERYRAYIREAGFDLLYDKSGLYDALRAIVEKNVSDDGTPLEPWQSARRITWNWQEEGDLQANLLNFLENHDEQRFASDFFGRSAGNTWAALYSSLLFGPESFMVYFGEEAGERGMDAEGLSGPDGRTTIFDWWSVASLRRLYRQIHGEEGLTREEKPFWERFCSLIRLRANDPVFSAGQSYDLCYCNASSPGFDSDRHFAFLRAFGGRALLVFCNFSSSTSTSTVHIPDHALEWLNLPAQTPRSLAVTVAPFDATIVRLI